MTRQRQIARTAAEAERDAIRIALALAGPKSADAGRPLAGQADAGHLPLFVASDEPRLI